MLKKTEEYRKLVKSSDLVPFKVKVEESDLFISAEKDLSEKTKNILIGVRAEIKNYIALDSDFRTSFKPYKVKKNVPEIIKEMAECSAVFNVGPMAAVAGAVAQYTGKGLRKYSNEIIIENGGDIYIAGDKPRTILIYAGNSPLSNKIGLCVCPEKEELGVCTSAGSFGHSFSYGKADAVIVVSDSAIYSDAAATALGNEIKSSNDFDKVIERVKKFEKIKGVFLIKGSEFAVWGDLELKKYEVT
jgi:ApbE superfamily uncharacterized protein (UPF0280 family)